MVRAALAGQAYRNHCQRKRTPCRQCSAFSVKHGNISSWGRRPQPARAPHPPDHQARRYTFAKTLPVALYHQPARTSLRSAPQLALQAQAQCRHQPRTPQSTFSLGGLLPRSLRLLPEVKSQRKHLLPVKAALALVQASHRRLSSATSGSCVMLLLIFRCQAPLLVSAMLALLPQ